MLCQIEADVDVWLSRWLHGPLFHAALR